MKRKLPKILFTSHLSGRKRKSDKPLAAHIAKGYVIFLAGLILGSSLSVFYKLPGFLCGTATLSEILLKTVPFSFGGYFCEVFLTVMTAVLMVFVLGFTAAAVPVIYAVPAFRGIGFGVMMTEIYGVFNLKGLLICLVAVVPLAVLTVISVCALSMDAVIVSRALTRYLFVADASPVKGTRVKIYFAKFIFSTLAAALAAFVHCLGVKLLLVAM